MLSLAVLALAFLLIGIVLQSRFRFFEYLFYCRFPLLAALTLGVLLPGGMFVFGKPVLGNLGDVSYAGMFWVAFVSTLTAWTVMFSTALVLRTVPLGLDKGAAHSDDGGWLSRWSLRFLRTPIVGRGLTNLISGLHSVTMGDGTIKRSRLVLYHTLTWWLLAGTAWTSSQMLTDGTLSTSFGELLANGALVLAGIGAAIILRFGAQRANARLKITETLSAQVMKRRPETEQAMWQGGGYFALLLVAYVAGWIVWQPGGVGQPILPVLVALNLLCLGLALVSSFLDESRFGVVLGLAMTIFVSFSIFDIDHYYELAPANTSESRSWSNEKLTPRTVVCQWRRARPGDRDPTMVIVTASGGALTAAHWTATVLAKLQQSNERFADSIVLLSTASGGGVGMMYFVDAFDAGGLTATALERAHRLSGESSLLSIVWGLAYEDLFAFIPRPFARRDRGWALEETWKLRLDDPTATLRHWKQDVLDGWRPVPIFNATVAETGERFLITPMDLEATKPKRYFNNLPPAAAPGDGPITSRAVTAKKLWDARHFFDLYPKSDLHVATAARLSATFPFVSPIPEPTGGDATDENAFHIVDGGYYDNHGVISAIDFLRDVLPQYDEIATECGGVAASEEAASNLPTVLIVQIRAGGPADKQPADRDGFAWTTIGPLDALMNVRETSQISRNDSQLEMLFEEMRGTANLHTVVFDFEDAELPFSWHLSDVDKKRIQKLWDQQPPALVKAVNALLH